MIKVWTDGSGKGVFCCFIEFSDGRKEFYDGQLEHITSNRAEYHGLILALDKLKEYKGYITIYSDSQLMVEQVNGNYATKSLELRELSRKARTIITDNKMNVELVWVPRKENKAGKFLG